MLVVNGARLDKVVGVLRKSGPPETLADLSPSLGTWMTHCRTSNLKASGSYRKLGGQVLGTGLPSVATLSLSSMS